MLTKLLIAGIGILIVYIIYLQTGFVRLLHLPGSTNFTFTPIAAPTPYNPFPYVIPKISVKRSYLTMLVGDSITKALGPNAPGLREDLISLYPNHEFVNYNYGFASTNILSLTDRLNKEVVDDNVKFPAILGQGFDLIIIESFAYNPLSQFPLEEGLKKYEETLDADIKMVIAAKPNSGLALMTPIAPNKETFAKYNYDLSPAKRLEWVAEREAYINKLIEYANKNSIPLINVYEKSLDKNHDGDLKYIDPHDYIHPSKEGVKLIEKTISDFIFQNKLFPE